MEPKTAFAKGTFDPVEFRRSEYGRNALEMQKIVEQYPDAPMHPDVLEYWERRGAKKEVYEIGTQHAWSVFTPLDMNQEKKYPLIYCSHGGGEDYYTAETYGYNLLVQPMQIICVYPQNGNPFNGEIETEFPRILNELEAKGYPIDRTRVYATGFSAGSVASLRLALVYPELLAGIGPVPGSNSFRGGLLAERLPAYIKDVKLQMPLICVGGTEDGGDSWPLTEAAHFHSLNLWMQGVAKIGNYVPMTVETSRELQKSSPDSVKRLFGLDFDETWIGQQEGTFWYCGQYYDDAGVPLARFIGIEGMPHLHCKQEAAEIYSYLKQFSRDPETKELKYADHNVNFALHS